MGGLVVVTSAGVSPAFCNCTNSFSLESFHSKIQYSAISLAFSILATVSVSCAVIAIRPLILGIIILWRLVLLGKFAVEDLCLCLMQYYLELN